MDLTTTQIIAIRNTAVLHACLKDRCQNDNLLTTDIESMSIDESNTLHNAAHYALRNYAPIIEDHLAEQDKGVYSVQIHGVPGAFYVRANDYDDEGVFDSLDDARACVEYKWGEFLVAARSENSDLAEDDNDDGEETEAPEEQDETISDELIAALSGSLDSETNSKLRAVVENNPVLKSMAQLKNVSYIDYPADLIAAKKAYFQTWPKPSGHGSSLRQLHRMGVIGEAALLFYRVRGTVPTPADLKALDLAI
jgi:hypothetical protein